VISDRLTNIFYKDTITTQGKLKCIMLSTIINSEKSPKTRERTEPSHERCCMPSGGSRGGDEGDASPPPAHR